MNADNQQFIGQGLDCTLFQTVFEYHSRFFIVKAYRESGNEHLSFIHPLFPTYYNWIQLVSQECGLLHAGSCILPPWH